MGALGRSPSQAPPLSAPAPIQSHHDCSRFTCGHDTLDDWLRLRALENEGKSARTFVVARGAKVVGYYCLAAGSERRANMPGRIRHGLPDPVPLILIGRLAVDQSCQGQKLGAGLLRDALLRALAAAQSIGTRAILVHAVDQAAVTFYSGFGFTEWPAESRTLFLPVETIARAI